MDFKPFPKIKRLFREVVVTEKIDGTNAQIHIEHVIPINPKEDFGAMAEMPHPAGFGRYLMWAGSRNRWITPENDNMGFAKWVVANQEELFKLGDGSHFGEWWGKGIQRNYAQTEKRFSLFNVAKWSDPEVRPKCCDVVPVLYQGDFHTEKIKAVLRDLQKNGSVAAPGFMDVEGIIVYHTASNFLFKYTVDDNHKGNES